jgi:uncharacterized membrane protein
MADDHSSQEILAQISERLEYLEYSLREQIMRIYAIEQKLGLAPPPSPPPVVATKAVPPPPPPAAATVSPPVEEPPPPVGELSRMVETSPAEPRGGQIAFTPEGPVVVETSGPQFQPAATGIEEATLGKASSSRDLETLIGGTWFNRIGIIAIILGVGYFLREAFRRGWIGPQGRVIIGVVIGIGLLYGGERIRARGYRSYAQGLSGGGIAILYLSFFAAFARFGLIGQTPAFLLMSLVTATAVLLAARYDALAIAILGLIGGFLTPILLSTGQDNQPGLFTYIALLDAGVLALAYFKQWRVLNYLAFGATVLMSALWMLDWYAPEKLWLTIFFLTLLFVIFAVLAIFHNVINKRPTRPLDLGLIFSNAAIYFTTCYGLLETEYRPYLGLFALLISAFYLSLGYITHRRDPEDRYLILTFIGLATIFLTIAVPIQFDQHWVTMAWAIEGSVLTWIGLRAGNRTTRYAAITVFLVALGHWFAIDLGESMFAHAGSLIPVFNRRGFSAMVLIASLAITARLYRRYGQTVNSNERDGFDAACILAANFLALVWLSWDVQDYFHQARANLPVADGEAAEQNLRGRLNNSNTFTLSALWIFYALAALIIGISRNSRVLRLGALFVLGLSIFKVLTADARFYAATWHTLIFNQTFLTFALLTAVLAFGAWYYSRSAGIDQRERTTAIILLIAAANVMAIFGLSLEARGFFEAESARRGFENRDKLEDTKQFTLTALWTIYGATAVAIGVRRQSKMIRFGALGLLAIAACKVLVVDLGNYAAPWHRLIFNQTFGAFVFLIAALACALWFYSRGEGINKDERSLVLAVLTIALNLFAIIGLSAEAVGRFDSQISARDITEDFQDLLLGKRLSLSIIWAAYGGAMLGIGLWRGNRLLRVMALGLLAITIVKVFLLDLASLDRIYRIISFIVLGAILLAVSFLYQQWQRRESGKSL